MDDEICLIVLLRPQIELGIMDHCPGHQVLIDQTQFCETDHGEITGHYDWIRDSGKVVGIRYWPFDFTEFMFDVVAKLPYVVISPHRSNFEIYFSSIPKPASGRSDDQHFGCNKIYFSPQGDSLITFGTGTLTRTERDSILTLDANWIT